MSGKMNLRTRKQLDAEFASVAAYGVECVVLHTLDWRDDFYDDCIMACRGSATDSSRRLMRG